MLKAGSVADASARALPCRVRGLTVDYGAGPVLRNVDFAAAAGSLVAVVGPNGAGKSTLIKAALGLQPVIAGQTLFWGEPLRRARGRVAYVPQRGAVDWDFPVSVREVVAMGRYRMLGWLRPVSAAHQRAALEHLDRVGMADFADRQISRLSGGQQQRVFIARALAQEADLYFMDEPFAGVDAATEQAIVEVLRGLRAQGKTAVVVHHDLATVRTYFDSLLLLNGEAVAAGAVDATFTADNLQRAYGGRLAFVAGALAPAPGA